MLVIHHKIIFHLIFISFIQTKFILNLQTQQQANVCNQNECTFGTCEILSTYNYQCHCNKGITGKNCNQRIPINNLNNLCLTNPCYNNSTCNMLSNGSQFICICNSNLNGGLLCKATLNNCQCQNGGTCNTINYNGINTYECTCPNGFGLVIYISVIFYKKSPNPSR